jgi:hypothetical protein
MSNLSVMMTLLTKLGEAIIMITLKRINWTCMLVLGLLCAGCSTEQCPNFNPVFIVENWYAAAPKQVKLIQYKKNSEFKVIDKSISELTIKKGYSKDMTYNSLQVYPKGELPVNADYRLILDNTFEYNITNIVTTNRESLGCPLNAAQVNACKAHAFRSINFDNSCGTQVSGK